MERRRGGKLMQRAAGQPAAERGIDRGGKPNQPLLARQARAQLLGSIPASVWRRRFSVGCDAAGPMGISLYVHVLF